MTTYITDLNDRRYLGWNLELVENILREGFGTAKTARGCRGAIRRGLKATYGTDAGVFERNGWYSATKVIGSEGAEYEWAIAVSMYLTNPNFYAEPETGSTLAVYPI